MHEPESDEIKALVARAAGGDRAAVADLLGAHLDSLQAFVRRRMGAPLLRRESTSDVVQSICREVLEKSHRFRFPEENAFQRWLFAMAERKLGHRRDYHAAARRAQRREAAPPTSVDLDALGGGEGPTPSRCAAAREEMQRVERAFARLPEHYREVIVQARILGMSREQIAAASGRAPAAVGNMLFRALAALAEALQEGEERPAGGR
jgi:RNA polymerase sigma factor (sigma-70 family)